VEETERVSKFGYDKYLGVRFVSPPLVGGVNIKFDEQSQRQGHQHNPSHNGQREPGGPEITPNADFTEHTDTKMKPWSFVKGTRKEICGLAHRRSRNITVLKIY
jgi:hypothetical protein